MMNRRPFKTVIVRIGQIAAGLTRNARMARYFPCATHAQALAGNDRGPTRYLIRDGLTKWLLREAGAGLVPDAVRLDRRKRGFNASIDSLVDRDDPQTRDRLLAPGPIFDLVRRDAVERFLDRDMTDNSFSKFLFSFISAKLFLEHHREWGREAA